MSAEDISILGEGEGVAGIYRTNDPSGVTDKSFLAFRVDEKGFLFIHPDSVPETVASVSNGEDGTYEYYIDMSYHHKLAFQFKVNGGSGAVTITIWASLQDDGTDKELLDYYDITEAFGNDTFTSSNIVSDEGFTWGASYVKVKVVSSTGGMNDASWKIYSTKSY